MTRVTGIGGIFIKGRDPKALTEWYRVHLGVPVQPWGGASFEWVTPENPAGVGQTAWNISKMDSKSFEPSTASFMVNYRVKDVHALIAQLRAEGCNVVGNIDESEYGKFGWVMDPEGNKVELWEPPAGQ